MKLSRRNFLSGSAVLASVAAISGRSQAGTIPEAPTTDSPLMRPPVAPSSGQDYHAGGDAKRLDAALADERRVEGIPSRGRAGAARNRAGHEGKFVGL